MQQSPSRKRRASAADQVLAAAAGKNSWKTWAGRAHGNDDFELMDVVRGASRCLQKRFLWKIPPAGTACPICFCVPERSDEWFLASSCGHATCKDCLRSYAAVCVKDPEYDDDFLKCGVCKLALRQNDAIVALAHDADLLRAFDNRIRDRVLRALPSFRHCPKCGNRDTENNGTSTPSSLAGGGFVTPECLMPQYEARENAAEQVLSQARHFLFATLALYVAYVLVYIEWYSGPVELVDLFNLIPVPICVLWKVGRWIARWTAQMARQAISQPIQVECPCCADSFLLNTESEFSSPAGLADKETEKWIGNNTRPCPSCSVPISKDSGCNHMRCTHCRAQFCWACMQVRTTCAAYGCHYGAPFGEATPGRQNNLNHNLLLFGGDVTIMERISELETISNNISNTMRKDIGVVVALSAFVICRKAWLVKMLSGGLMSLFVVAFNGNAIMMLVSFWMSVSVILDLRRRPRRGANPHQVRAGGAGNAVLDAFLRYRHGAVPEANAFNGDGANIDRSQFHRMPVNQLRRVEEELVAQAIARSRVEQ